MKKVIYLLLALTLGSTSCSYLDVEPQDFASPNNFYKNKDQIDQALAGVYQTLASPDLYGESYLGLYGLQADLGFYSDNMRNFTACDYNVTPTDVYIGKYWQTLYAGIARANLLLEGINKLTKKIDGVDEVWAQTVFLRAYFHFMLVSRFNNIPIIDKTPSGLGKDDIQIAATPGAEVYEWIDKQMNDAIPLLKTASEAQIGSYPSQTAVKGILARVALYAAGHPYNNPSKYAQATRYANEVIRSGQHALNVVAGPNINVQKNYTPTPFSQIFTNLAQDIYDVKESMFEVEFWGDGTGVYGRAAGMVTRYIGIQQKTQNAYPGYASAGLNPSQYAYDVFENRTDDTRRERTVSTYTYNGSGVKGPAAASVWERKVSKFLREDELAPVSAKARYYGSCNWPILRYADVLLMYAESVASDPNSSSGSDLAFAIECLNQVRRRGFNLPINEPNESVDFSGTKEDLAEYIKRERVRELAFEMLRKSDLVRWGIFIDQMKFMLQQCPPPTAGNDINIRANRYFSNALPRDEFWPIPTHEINVNRKLKQNPGW